MENIKISFSNQIIRIFDNSNTLKGVLEYNCDSAIIITRIENYGDEDILEILISKLVALTFYLHKHIINDTEVSLLKHHFILINEMEFLNIDDVKIKRFVRVGKGITGKNNNICDVDGVKVGNFTIHDNTYHTGVTVISPHEGNIFREKVVASSYSFNGFGKSIGLVQIEELGTIETNITFTSTLNVSKISDGVVSHALEENPEIGVSTGTVNPVVMECNDGTLNQSRDRIMGRQSYYKALGELDTDFLQGDEGAGAGMICHGFKGGLGSSSRIIKIGDKEYTIGVIVNSNFGSSNGKDLIFRGRELGDLIKKHSSDEEDKGSIVAVVATDLPVNERQIKRLLKRVEIGIGRTGSYAGNGSGDVFVGFSTANKREHFNNEAISNVEYLSDNNISSAFKSVVEATEEAVLNSMLFAKHTKGFMKEVKSLNEVNELFGDLLDEEIIWDIA